MAAYRVLAIAAGTGRVGYAFMEGDQLTDWGLSKAASRSPALTAKKVRYWIELLKPEVVVFERLTPESRKRGRTVLLLAAIARTAKSASVISAAIPRRHLYRNKYEEAEALVRRFPDLKPRLPAKPPIWLPEPPNLIIFEAVTLALGVTGETIPDR